MEQNATQQSFATERECTFQKNPGMYGCKHDLILGHLSFSANNLNLWKNGLRADNFSILLCSLEPAANIKVHNEYILCNLKHNLSLENIDIF